jgi:hypothetical protein
MQESGTANPDGTASAAAPSATSTRYLAVLPATDPPPMENRRHAKRLIKIVFGFTLLAGGGAMLLLPGPGIVTIMLGLALLAAEYAWAKRLLDRFKEAGQTALNAVTRGPDDRPR